MRPFIVPRLLIIILFLTFVAFACWQAINYRAYMVDDAYITFRYARNLSQGAGFAYNGNQQIEGYSNFLLLLLLAVGNRFGIQPPLLSQLIGISALLGLLALLFAETERQTGSGLGMLVAPMLLSSCVAISYWAVAGLETLLYTFLLTASVILASRVVDGKVSLIFMWLLLPLLVLCRTEGAAPAGLIAAWTTWKGLPTKGATKDRFFTWFKALLPIIVVIVIFHGFRIAWFGSFQSAPALAKYKGSIEPLREGIRYFATFFIEYFPPILVLFAGYAVLQPTSLTWPMLIVSAFQTIIVFSLGGDWMPMYRMFIPILPLLFLEVGRGCRLVCRQLPIMKPACGLAILLTATKLAFFPVVQGINIKQYKRLDMLFIEVSKMLKKNYPPSTRLVLGDIGRVGYETGFEIYDMKGLVSPWVSSTYKTVREGSHLRVSIDCETILSKRPELVLVAINPNSKDGMLDDGMHRGFWSCDTDMLKSKTLQQGWRIIAKIGENNPLGCIYLLFERKDLRREKID